MPRAVQLSIFITIASLLTGLIHYYLWARLVRDPQLAAPWRQIATTTLVALWVVMFAAFAISRNGPTWLKPIVWVSYIWMGTMFYLFLVTAFGDLVRAPLGRNQDPERRLYLYRLFGGAIATIGAGLGALALRSGLGKPRTAEVEIPVRGLAPPLVGLTIVQMTDIHVGATIHKQFIEHLVERTLALQPDIIAITGDLVDGSVSDLREHVAPLAKLKAPLGVYFVTGNHEYYSGAAEWVAELTRIGIRVLRNERVTVEKNGAKLEIAGVDDFSSHGLAVGHGHDPQKALADRDRALPCILLAHQPKSVIDAAKYGVSLQLSGHTHGGQLWPWGYMVRLQQPYVAGLYDHDGVKLYVSRGTGYWGPPMRLGAPAEITHLKLAAAAA